MEEMVTRTLRPGSMENRKAAPPQKFKGKAVSVNGHTVPSRGGRSTKIQCSEMHRRVARFVVVRYQRF